MRTMSGSARKMDRSTAENLSPALVLICTWVAPSSWYSTGSSTVTTALSPVMTSFKVA